MNLPEYVKIVEVGPRDGLQNESRPVATDIKIEFINRLSATGLPVIEVTSMVKPGRVPQLADAEEVYQRIIKQRGVSYPVLVPNLRGLERAVSVGTEEISLFTSASETFNQKNINCTIPESLQRFEAVFEHARETNLRIRAYISCAFGNPYANDVDTDKVASLAELLVTMGCAEVSLADTFGSCTPLHTQQVINTVLKHVSVNNIAVHFHDTRGQALANILACLELGVSIIDASTAGLGGCPFAQAASGNVATEDVLYMLKGMNIETGVNLDTLIEVGNFISEQLGRDNQSKVGSLGLSHEI